MDQKINIKLEEAKKKLEPFKSLFDPLHEAHLKASSFNALLAKTIIPLGIDLSVEKDIDKLLYKILKGAKEVCGADGGTLYLKKGDHLEFKIVMNDSLGIDLKKEDVEKSNFSPIVLFDENSGEYNFKNVASLSAIEKKMIHIEDAYASEEFDFSGTKIFDKKNDYRSTSFLTLPLLNYHGEVMGVLQLINCKNTSNGETIPFARTMREGVQSLASLAATALENQLLLCAEKELMQSFIRLISGAIDKKSPYTGGHCARVPDITMRIAEAAIAKREGCFKDFALNAEEKEELQTAAWLHDIGKITTPEYVVDKATKLETIFDRIEVVRLRCELLIKDLEIEVLRNPKREKECLEKMDACKAAISFLKEVNFGGEFLSDEDEARIVELSKWSFVNHLGQTEVLLREDEVKNLCVKRGTLNDEERQVINQHIDVTIQMLEELPLPNHLKRIVEYAGGHHEKIDGTGYPKGLKGDEMSIPARIMAVADIFEALTASDRPYKKGKTLSEAIRIMSFMVKDAHIDEDIYRLFLEERIFEDYAAQFLKPEQIDVVKIEDFL